MSTSNNPNGYAVGDRVEFHPATDAWMGGWRYGVVTVVGRKWLHVRAERLAATTIVAMPLTGDLAPTKL